MALDPAVEGAIETVVRSIDQSPKVAKRLISWLEDMSKKDLSVEEQNEHLQALMGAIALTAVGRE